MERRKLGGVSISRLGLGTMTWGRDTDENEAAQQLQYFVEAGGNLIDTAVFLRARNDFNYISFPYNKRFCYLLGVHNVGS